MWSKDDRSDTRFARESVWGCQQHLCRTEETMKGLDFIMPRSGLTRQGTDRTGRLISSTAGTVKLVDARELFHMTFSDDSVRFSVGLLRRIRFPNPVCRYRAEEAARPSSASGGALTALMGLFMEHVNSVSNVWPVPSTAGMSCLSKRIGDAACL